MARFDDRVALVTGAGKGIGAAIARALAAEGAAVGAFDLDPAAAAATVAAIEADGGRGLTLAGDTRREADVRRAVAATVEELGALHLLAPVAGVMRLGPTAEVPRDELDLVLDTNVKGPLLVVAAAIGELRRAGGGAIVLAASAMGYTSTPFAAAYSASKGAIVALTNALALEFASDGVRVNAIAPGSVRTPLLRGFAELAEGDPDATMEEWGRAHPIGRLIEPEEVAQLACFLLSDEASAVTGACHRVDGGLLSRLPG